MGLVNQKEPGVLFGPRPRIRTSCLTHASHWTHKTQDGFHQNPKTQIQRKSHRNPKEKQKREIYKQSSERWRPRLVLRKDLQKTRPQAKKRRTVNITAFLSPTCLEVLENSGETLGSRVQPPQHTQTETGLPRRTEGGGQGPKLL